MVPNIVLGSVSVHTLFSRNNSLNDIEMTYTTIGVKLVGMARYGAPFVVFSPLASHKSPPHNNESPFRWVSFFLTSTIQGEG